MKKSSGRKYRRNLAKRNKREASRKIIKANELLQKRENRNKKKARKLMIKAKVAERKEKSA